MAPNWPAPLNPTGKQLTAIFEVRHRQVHVLGLTPAEFHVLLLEPIPKPLPSAFAPSGGCERGASLRRLDIALQLCLRLALRFPLSPPIRRELLGPGSWDRLLVEKLDESTFPAGIPRWMMPRPVTISRLLDRMEDGRLPTRVSNPDNEKAKHVVMTRKGEGDSGVRPGGLPLCALATSKQRYPFGALPSSRGARSLLEGQISEIYLLLDHHAACHLQERASRLRPQPQLRWERDGPRTGEARGRVRVGERGRRTEGT